MIRLCSIRATWTNIALLCKITRGLHHVLFFLEETEQFGVNKNVCCYARKTRSDECRALKQGITKESYLLLLSGGGMEYKYFLLGWTICVMLTQHKSSTWTRKYAWEQIKEAFYSSGKVNVWIKWSVCLYNRVGWFKGLRGRPIFMPYNRPTPLIIFLSYFKCAPVC